MIGHELTAIHGLTHAHTLAMVMPGTMRILKEQNMERFCNLVKGFLI